METLLTRAIMIIALACVLVVGAAAAAILGRDSVPAAGFNTRFDVAAAPAARGPVSNKEGKKDKLAVTMALAAFEPPQQTATLSEPLRQAYASAAPSDIGAPNIVAAPVAPPKPKAASKPQVQKNYALLNDVQIAGSKDRLKLTPDPESYWPRIEKGLRAI